MTPPDNWGRFLEARRNLIDEWRSEGKTCTEIVNLLAMDPGQVYLISRVETDDVPKDARTAIVEVRDRAMRVLGDS